MQTKQQKALESKLLKQSSTNSEETDNPLEKIAKYFKIFTLLLHIKYLNKK